MKQLMVMMFALVLALNAGAQVKISGRVGHPGPRVIVTAPVYPYYGSGYGLGYGYSPLYGPFYSPFNDPYYANRFREPSSPKLRLEIEDIENDYSYRISTVRHDKTISGSERRQKIRDLKHEKEGAIIDAKRNFYGNRSNS